jgi:hypothetical protein
MCHGIIDEIPRSTYRVNIKRDNHQQKDPEARLQTAL